LLVAEGVGCIAESKWHGVAMSAIALAQGIPAFAGTTLV
jgi:hypothetical protein